MQYWCSYSVIFNVYQIVKIYGNWKISAFYCCIRLVISLALPLSLLPFTFGTRIVFLQWNVSQCVKIWIFNISNTDLFTQTIYLWCKYYSKWICVTFSFQYIKKCIDAYIWTSSFGNSQIIIMLWIVTLYVLYLLRSSWNPQTLFSIPRYKFHDLMSFLNLEKRWNLLSWHKHSEMYPLLQNYKTPRIPNGLWRYRCQKVDWMSGIWYSCHWHHDDYWLTGNYLQAKDVARLKMCIHMFISPVFSK